MYNKKIINKFLAIKQTQIKVLKMKEEAVR
jgi:hypothetical protein